MPPRRSKEKMEREIAARVASAVPAPDVTDRIRMLERPVYKTAHPGRDAARDTTPGHIWRAAVLEIAGVSFDEAERYATRERISRAYQEGEPAWMAADMVRQLVRGGG